MFNVIVVDDETFIREGIINRLKQKIPDIRIVGGAEDAMEALDILRGNPGQVDLVITDIRMPEIDGLEFIEIAKRENPGLDFIIVSGYQDFSYARTAIRLGVEDYLLKPIDNVQLLSIFEKLRQERREKDESEKALKQLLASRQQHFEQMKRQYLGQLITASELNTIETTLNKLREFSIDLNKPCFCLLTIEFARIAGYQAFPEKEDFALIKFLAGNIAEELLSASGLAVPILATANEKQIAILLNYNYPLDNHQTLHYRCQKILDTVGQYLKADIMIGIGNSYDHVQDIIKSYGESQNACLQKIVTGFNQVIFAGDIVTGQPSDSILSQPVVKNLENLILSADRGGAEAVIDNMISQIRTRSLDYQQIRLFSFEILLLLDRLLKDNNKAPAGFAIEDILSDKTLVKYSGSLAEFRTWLSDMINSTIGYLEKERQGAGKSAIHEIRQYIDRHYCSDVSLNDIASRYYLNSSYLSQAFKAEYGVNFMTYLKNVRLSKAKEHLANSSLPAKEIGEMVGYPNFRYFYNLFTKNEGLTPSEYRKKFKS